MVRELTSRLGAHVSTAGGLSRAVDRARDIGAECVQIFASAPQQWRPPKHDDEQVLRFRAACKAAGIAPVVLHSIYLVNPASVDAAIRARTIAALQEALRWADRLGAEAVITHLGSATGDSLEAALDRLCDSLRQVLRDHAGEAMLLLETCAGQGMTLGRRFEQIGEAIQRLGGHPRLGAALDTAHVFAAGYDVSSEAGLDDTMTAFDRHVGVERLRAVHLNDSRSTLGSNVDRHANLGEGHLGLAALERFVRHAAVDGLPLLLEVPGLDRQGPDRRNMELLYGIAGRQLPPR